MSRPRLSLSLSFPPTTIPPRTLIVGRLTLLLPPVFFITSRLNAILAVRSVRGYRLRPENVTTLLLLLLLLLVRALLPPLPPGAHPSPSFTAQTRISILYFTYLNLYVWYVYTYTCVRLLGRGCAASPRTLL